jgi:glutamyl/glutaminyl-tRNA synthetase
MNKMVKSLIQKLDELYVWTAEEIQKTLDEHRKEIEWKPKDYYMPVRLMATGRKDSPPLAESLELIGREIVRFRLRDALKNSDIKQ